MKKVSEYRKCFEQIKQMEDPVERKSDLEKLLMVYRNDTNIKKMSKICSFSRDTESIGKIDHLDFEIFAEIKEPRITESKRKDKKTLLRYFNLIYEHYKQSPFRADSAEAYRRKYTPTQEDIAKVVFTI